MAIYCIWPDDTYCTHEELEEYLTFMSDDYVKVNVEEDDEEEIPTYDEVMDSRDIVKPLRF